MKHEEKKVKEEEEEKGESKARGEEEAQARSWSSVAPTPPRTPKRGLTRQHCTRVDLDNNI